MPTSTRSLRSPGGARSWHLGPVAISCALLLLAGACSSDSDDASSGTTAASSVTTGASTSGPCPTEVDAEEFARRVGCPWAPLAGPSSAPAALDEVLRGR